MSRKIIIWGKTYQKTVIGSGQKVEIPFNRTVTRAFGASRDRRSGPCQVAERAPPLSLVVFPTFFAKYAAQDA